MARCDSAMRPVGAARERECFVSVTKRLDVTAASCCLGNVPAFASFSEEVLQRIQAHLSQRAYERHQIIFFPSDPCDCVYWVCCGHARLARLNGDGRELTFRHVKAGDMFGEEFLAGEVVRNVHAEALEPTRLCFMGAADFVKLSGEIPELALATARMLSRRRVSLESRLAELVFLSVRQRIAAALFRMHKLYRTDLLHVTHQEIAALVGSTRETTTAALHQLREEGLLEIASRRIVVKDPEGLERMTRST